MRRLKLHRGGIIFADLTGASVEPISRVVADVHLANGKTYRVRVRESLRLLLTGDAGAPDHAPDSADELPSAAELGAMNKGPLLLLYHRRTGDELSTSLTKPAILLAFKDLRTLEDTTS